MDLDHHAATFLSQRASNQRLDVADREQARVESALLALLRPRSVANLASCSACQRHHSVRGSTGGGSDVTRMFTSIRSASGPTSRLVSGHAARGAARHSSFA